MDIQQDKVHRQGSTLVRAQHQQSSALLQGLKFVSPSGQCLMKVPPGEQPTCFNALWLKMGLVQNNFDKLEGN